jgi:hypothetical protein
VGQGTVFKLQQGEKTTSLQQELQQERGEKMNENENMQALL